MSDREPLRQQGIAPRRVPGQPLRGASQRLGFQIRPGTSEGQVPRQSSRDGSQERTTYSPTLRRDMPSSRTPGPGPLPELNTYFQFNAQQRRSQEGFDPQHRSVSENVVGSQRPEMGRRISSYRQQRLAETGTGGVSPVSPPPSHGPLPPLPGSQDRQQQDTFRTPHTATAPVATYDPVFNQPYSNLHDQDTSYGHHNDDMHDQKTDHAAALEMGNIRPSYSAYESYDSTMTNRNIEQPSRTYRPGAPLQQTYTASNSNHPYMSHSRDGSSENPFSSTHALAPVVVHPYPRRPSSLGPPNHADLGMINPADIEDDEHDPFTSPPIKSKKRGLLGNSAGAGGIAGAGAGASVTGAAAATSQKPGGFFKGITSRDTSGQYGQVPVTEAGLSQPEKSEWLDKETHSNKRLKWIVGGSIVLIIVLAIIGGVVGAVITSKKSLSSTPSPSAGQNSGLTSNSAEVKALMNNPDLHKVFPGIDYTPINSQYPACLTNPPSQDNVTLDMAVLSQLTPIVRLYGTDCKQTEMVLEAIKALDLESEVKVWMGVWLDTNASTNARQLSQMYSVFDKYGGDQFAGVIVGNEVLFREDMTQTQLIDVLENVRSNLSDHNVKLPVATSDLGSKWTTTLAGAVDAVMANIHPFFGGVPAAQAAVWTYEFWQTNDVSVSQGTSKPNIIAETGWPSGGGNDCGTDATCTSSTVGSVAGIDEMNMFLDGWVCGALTNGTNYFWFEAFDEPWKIVYNTPTEQWEDKWGLLDVNRNLKSGVKIPDCGGKTATLPS